jgi:ATP-dependent DNA helicase PIF1
MHNGILAHLQEHWRERAYLIIDEKSMVGLKELYWIDSTIMSKPELEFGGLNVVLFGDFYQLPPVCSKPMYDSGVVSDPAWLT